MLEREKAELERFSDAGDDDNFGDGDVGLGDNDENADYNDDVAARKSLWRRPIVGRRRRTGR